MHFQPSISIFYRRSITHPINNHKYSVAREQAMLTEFPRIINLSIVFYEQVANTKLLLRFSEAQEYRGQPFRFSICKALEFTNWFGFVAPSQTPKNVISKLHQNIAKVLSTTEMINDLQQMGAEVIANTPAQFTDQIQSDASKWGKIIKDNNIKSY